MVYTGKAMECIHGKAQAKSNDFPFPWLSSHLYNLFLDLGLSHLGSRLQCMCDAYSLACTCTVIVTCKCEDGYDVNPIFCL